MLWSWNKIQKVALTDCGDVWRVKFIVRESAQQACFPNPGISKKQESEEHIVLLSHGVRSYFYAIFFFNFLQKCKPKAANSMIGEKFLLTCDPCLLKRWTEGFRYVSGFVVHWRLVNNTGMLQPLRQPASCFQWVRWTTVKKDFLLGSNFRLFLSS